MLSLLFFVIAAVLFLVRWLGGHISDWDVVAAGLFFLALGHMFGGIGPGLGSFRRRF